MVIWYFPDSDDYAVSDQFNLGVLLHTTAIVKLIANGVQPPNGVQFRSGEKWTTLRLLPVNGLGHLAGLL